MLRRRSIQAHPTASEGGYIFSANIGDQEVFRVLMDNGVSSDGIGITKDDASRVSTIGQWFYNNTEIVSFDELEYFTALSIIQDNGFRNCSSLERLTIPKNVSTIGARALYSLTNFKVLTILHSESVLKISSNTIYKVSFEAIYVPDALVDAYKAASYWSSYADSIKPLSEKL